MRFIWILITFLAFNAQSVFADEAHPLMSSEEVDIATKIKNKSYPGAIDEDPLKIQAKITNKKTTDDTVDTSDANPTSDDD